MKIKIMAVTLMLAVLMLVMEAQAAVRGVFNPNFTLCVLVANQGHEIGTKIESGYRLEQRTLINLKHTNVTDISVWGFSGKPSRMPRIDMRITDRVMSGKFIAARHYQLVSDFKGNPIAGSVQRVYADLENDTIVSRPLRDIPLDSKEFKEKWLLTLSRFVYVPEYMFDGR